MKKNIKTTFVTKKNQTPETVLFYASLKDSPYFSPSSHIQWGSLHGIKGEFTKFVEQVNNLTLSNIRFTPVTVENREDVINRQQYRGYSTWEHNASGSRLNIESPLVIRGANIPEFDIVSNKYPNKDRRFYASTSSSDALTANQSTILKDQFVPQLMPHLTEELLETLKHDAIKVGKKNFTEYLSEQSKYLEELAQELSEFE